MPHSCPIPCCISRSGSRVKLCQSEQDGKRRCSRRSPVLRRWTTLRRFGNPDDWFTFPLNGCYTLTADITQPDDWQPISGFHGHFNADGHSITLGGNSKPVFAQAGLLGASHGSWNLGIDPTHGYPSISNLMGKTTGVARVMGHLNQLFGTGSAEDYGGYTVTVTDADGKEYRVKTNREGQIRTCKPALHRWAAGGARLPTAPAAK